MKNLLVQFVIIVSFFSCNQSSKHSSVFNNEPDFKNSYIKIKASSGNYITLINDTINGINNKLISTTTDSALADKFYIEFLPEGKVTFKTITNFYVCADRYKNNNLIADRTSANEWEKFVLIKIEGNKFNIRSSDGKFICEDRDLGNVIIANRDNAAEWETFIFE